MEDYKHYYVNGKRVSKENYDKALKEGIVEVRVLHYRDGTIISDVTNSPLVKDLYGYGLQISDEKDMVNSPDHYVKLKENLNGLEIIDILEVVSEQYPIRISGHIWNALKYIFRAPFKGRLKQDLEKSIWYLNRALKRLGDDVE